MSIANKQELISVVAPVYNEEGVIEKFLDRLLAIGRKLRDKYRFEIVLVDDGSTDRSLKLCKQYAERNKLETIRIVELRRNFGQTAALQAGLDEAAGDIIITLDSDLQHFPEEIPNFLAKIEEGYDVVCGWRHQRQEGMIRRYPSRVANLMIKRISKIEIHDFGTTFRAYRQDIIKELRLLGEQHRFIPVIAATVGARITEIPIENIERPVGKSNYGISRTFSVFLDLIFLYFNVKYIDRPLKAFGKAAVAFLALALLILVPMTVYGFWFGEHTVSKHVGWFMLGISSLIASLNFMMTGILAEVLVRVYFSSAGSQKTFYKVRKVWGE